MDNYQGVGGITIAVSAVTGTAQAGAAGSITLAAAGSSAIDGFYIGQIISITSGTGSGDSGLITAYNGTSKVCAVQRISATFTPGASSAYSIAPNVSMWTVCPYWVSYRTPIDDLEDP
jgi:hypothetical protein